MSQFADDTNLFCADLPSLENALHLFGSFDAVSGLKLNIQKTKAMWLGNLANQKDQPLNLTWVKNPMRILGVFFSHDCQGNNNHDFDHKIQKLQTNLDTRRARDLTTFGKVLIIKGLGLSPLVYSTSNTDEPREVVRNVQGRLFKSLWNNKRDKIKRSGLYQDYEKGGLRMVDFELVIKAPRLTWIPRLLKSGQFKWKTIPDILFKKYDGLGFLLTCNYRMEDCEYLQRFIKAFYSSLMNLKNQYGNKGHQDMIL